MDEFDKKREVVQSLMQMLGKNAHDEVSGSMAPRPAMPDADDVKPAADVTIVLPEGHGEAPMAEEMKDDMAAVPAMSDGGPMEAPKEECSIEEQDDENNSSTPFESLMKRAKRMK